MQSRSSSDSPLLTDVEGPPAEVLNTSGGGGFLLVCEHASNRLPAALGDLGLSAEALRSHIAWDPGAFSVALKLSRRLDSPLVAARFSRLAYDCNRPPEAPDAIAEQSEVYRVHGNVGLNAFERAARAEALYAPFRSLLSGTIAKRSSPVIVTVHSFTPVYRGVRREVELGVLHDADARLADAVLALAPGATGMNTARNQPYGPLDGVTHTLREHALPAGLLNVMLEIRNDLISDEASCTAVAATLAEVLTAAVDSIRAPQSAAGAGG